MDMDKKKEKEGAGGRNLLERFWMLGVGIYSIPDIP